MSEKRTTSRQQNGMNVLITGPNLDSSKQVGGIITVIKTILSVISVPHAMFVRSPEQEKKGNLSGKVKWLGKIFGFIKINLSGKYTIVHVHTAMNKSAILRDFIWVFIGSFFKVKVLLHVHGGKFLFEVPPKGALLTIIHRMFRMSDALIVLSEKEKKTIEELYATKSPIHVLENAINLEEIPVMTENTVKRDLTKLIFIGRITESKGIHDIVEAFQLMNESERAHFTFDLYGQGELTAYMEEQLSTLLGQRFAYHGIVSGDGKWQAMQKADVFLLPSRYGEGLPMALLEAMALGKIVLTTDDASIGLVVHNEVNGYMVEKYNPALLKESLLSIHSAESTKIEHISEKAKATVQEHFSAHRYIQKLETIYQQTLNNN